ncbi:MAG: KpsF/GutQ family sugar-phosphate isomerase [Gammaproteobacteria bacterium]|nr:KpsF/GutQ family sugar-phosphate isomerase [Gammaproteobacteria bacterium]
MTAATDDDRFIALARRVIEIERDALGSLLPRIDQSFAAACRIMIACRGRIVVLGMGKSGHIGGKVAATLASTGTPSFFIHPGEASHGDMGMVTEQDVVLAISNSGETDEIVQLLPLLKRLGVPLIALTGKGDSTLGTQADVVLDVGVAQEACPLGMAPTSSTTAALAMGDALAIALLEARGFTVHDFARRHPGGSLRLLVKVAELMHRGAAIPCVAPGAPVTEALAEMTRGGLGLAVIADGERRVRGVFTDGDLRRALAGDIDARRTRIDAVMTPGCVTICEDRLAAEALHLMQQHRINGLPVVDGMARLVGVLNMHDLLRRRVI